MLYNLAMQPKKVFSIECEYHALLRFLDFQISFLFRYQVVRPR